MMLTRCHWRRLREKNKKILLKAWLFVFVAAVFPLKAVDHFLHQNRNTWPRIRLELDDECDQLADEDYKHLDVLLQLMVQLKILYHKLLLSNNFNSCQNLL